MNRPSQFASFFCFVSLFLVGCGGGGSSSNSFDPVSFKIETVVANAAFPVSLVQAKDGRIFYTELLTGNIRVIKDGNLSPIPVATLGTLGSGNEGLLGLAIDPDYLKNGFLYSYYTAKNPTRNIVTRIDTKQGVSKQTILIDNLPYGGHDGGRLVFGSDGTLFISVGDAGKPELAQSMDSFAGKILRINRDGTVPADNPDPSSPVFASGLRNAFGLAVDPRSSVLYASDNGPSCDDELNRIERGSNLGWRLNQPCGDVDGRYVQPLLRFNPPIAPTGISFYQGSAFVSLQNDLLVADYLTGSINRFQIDSQSGEVLKSETLIHGQLGQLIDVNTGVDGFIYLASTTAISRLVPAD